MNSIQDKFQKIMEVMSDKTLGKDCKVMCKLDNKIYTITGDSHKDSDGDICYPVKSRETSSIYGIDKYFTIIGKDNLHIGDVLDWIEKNAKPIAIISIIFKLWKDKRLPLSTTDEELVDYIYNLLP